MRPPVEGKVVRGEKGLDVGDRCRAKLVEVSVPNGWIRLRCDAMKQDAVVGTH